MSRPRKHANAASIYAVMICAALVPTGPVMAGTMATTAQLRQAAAAACTGDVLRLCPSVIFDEQQIFACMKASRAQLSPGCRTVFDEGAKTVTR